MSKNTKNSEREKRASRAKREETPLPYDPPTSEPPAPEVDDSYEWIGRFSCHF